MRSSLLALALLLATASQGGASPLQKSALGFQTMPHQLLNVTSSTCTRAGETICSDDCDLVVLCVSDGEGSFEYVPLDYCSEGTRCSAEQSICVSGSTACGAPKDAGIDCHDTGYFPDPYDCTKYHLCLDVDSVSQPYSCNPGYAYNALTTDCSFQTTDSVCTDGPIPACTSVGQNGAVATNPSIYYICTSSADEILIPLLYRCHNGLVYDPSVYSCVESITTTTTTTTTPTPATEPPATEAPPQ